MAKKALELNVSFSGISIGESTARLGVKVPRTALSLADADTQLNGRRLVGMIVMLGPGEDINQGTIVDDLRHEVSGMFDVKKLSITEDEISFGMTLNLKGIDVSELAHFATKKGLLSIDDIIDIPARATKDEDPEDENGDGEPELDDEVDDDRRPAVGVPTRVRLVRDIRGHATVVAGCREDAEFDVVSTGSDGAVTIQSNKGDMVNLKATDYTDVSMS